MTDGNARFVRSLFLSKTRKTRLSVSKSSKYGKMAIENIGGMNMVTPKYQRVVLKLSGEALAGDAGFGIKPPVIKEIIQEIKEVHEPILQEESKEIVEKENK